MPAPQTVHTELALALTRPDAQLVHTVALVALLNVPAEQLKHVRFEENWPTAHRNCVHDVEPLDTV